MNINQRKPPTNIYGSFFLLRCENLQKEGKKTVNTVSVKRMHYCQSYTVVFKVTDEIVESYKTSQD